MTETRSLEDRIRQLEDERDIRNLLVEYGRLLDALDYHGYAQLFASDGEWIGGLGHARGPEAIEAMLIDGLGLAPAGFVNNDSLHLMTNFQIRVAGDRATAVSKLLYMVKDAGGAPSPARAGNYLDELIREDGRWKFLRRVVMGDIPPQNPLGAAHPKEP